MTPMRTPSHALDGVGRQQRSCRSLRCSTFAETYGKRAPRQLLLEERTVSVIAAHNQAQQLARAFVELVIAERADDVAARLRERLDHIRQFALQPELENSARSQA